LELGLDRSLGNTEAGKLALFQVIARLINQGSSLSAVRFAKRHLACELKDLNITIKEGLDELSALSVHTLTFRNTSVNKIPEPSDIAQKLLERANIEIPRLLPSFRAK